MALKRIEVRNGIGLPANIRKGSKWVTMTNTPAYHGTE